jgi:hypothetical protein
MWRFLAEGDGEFEVLTFDDPGEPPYSAAIATAAS